MLLTLGRQTTEGSVRFTPTGIVGSCVVDVEPLRDERGFFARTYCAREFAEHDKDASWPLLDEQAAPR